MEVVEVERRMAAVTVKEEEWQSWQIHPGRRAWLGSFEMYGAFTVFVWVRVKWSYKSVSEEPNADRWLRPTEASRGWKIFWAWRSGVAEFSVVKMA